MYIDIVMGDDHADTKRRARLAVVGGRERRGGTVGGLRLEHRLPLEGLSITVNYN